MFDAKCVPYVREKFLQLSLPPFSHVHTGGMNKVHTGSMNRVCHLNFGPEIIDPGLTDIFLGILLWKRQYFVKNIDVP